MVGGNPETLAKIDDSVRGHPKTSKKVSDIERMVGGNPETLGKIDESVRGHPKTSKIAPKLFYAVAFGRKIGVFVNKWADTENLTKHFKGARFRSFKVPQDAWLYILELNKDVSLPDSLLEYYKLSKNEIEQFRSEMQKYKIAKD